MSETLQIIIGLLETIHHLRFWRSPVGQPNTKPLHQEASKAWVLAHSTARTSCSREQNLPSLTLTIDFSTRVLPFLREQAERDLAHTISLFIVHKKWPVSLFLQMRSSASAKIRRGSIPTQLLYFLRPYYWTCSVHIHIPSKLSTTQRCRKILMNLAQRIVSFTGILIFFKTILNGSRTDTVLGFQCWRSENKNSKTTP